MDNRRLPSRRALEVEVTLTHRTWSEIWLNFRRPSIGVADGLGVVHEPVSAVLARVVCVRDGESPIVRRGMGGSRPGGDGQLWPEETVRGARRSLSGTAEFRARRV